MDDTKQADAAYLEVLRDEFAGMAMARLIGSNQISPGLGNHEEVARSIPRGSAVMLVRTHRAMVKAMENGSDALDHDASGVAGTAKPEGENHG